MMPNEVFLDTAAVIALVNTEDRYHEEAIKILDNIDSSGQTIISTSEVLIEAANFFNGRGYHRLTVRAVQRLLDLRDDGALLLLFVDEELCMRGWKLLRNRPDKNWSLTDCISFVVMQDRRIKAAFTADRHFEQAGFECLLKKG